MLRPSLPLTTLELTGFWLYATCAKCQRSVRIHPMQPPLPRLALPDLLRRLSCRERNCGGRAGTLILTLPGYAIPGSKEQYSPRWVMDRSGEWAELETFNPFEA